MKYYLIALFFIFSTLSYGYEKTERVQKSYNFKTGGEVIVIGDEGFIRIKSWDKNEIQLEMIKHAWARTKREAEDLMEEIEVKIDQTTNRLYIRQKQLPGERNFSFWDLFDPDSWQRRRGTVAVDFLLTVPREVDLRLENDEGDVDVMDIKGNLDIDVDEGEIQLKNIDFKNIIVTMDEGNFDGYNLNGPTGRLKLDADEGDIRLDNAIVRKLSIDCDEGDIFVKNSQVTSCELTTDEGDIETALNLAPQGKCRMYTDEGDVSIYIPQDASLNLRLETDEGTIDTDFPLKITELEEGARLKARLGQGGPRLEVYTEEGDISLEMIK